MSEAYPPDQEQLASSMDEIMVLLPSALSAELRRWKKHACLALADE
jgi:hypothetical protein